MARFLTAILVHAACATCAFAADPTVLSNSTSALRGNASTVRPRAIDSGEPPLGAFLGLAAVFLAGVCCCCFGPKLDPRD